MPIVKQSSVTSADQALDVYRQVIGKYSATGADHAVIRDSYEYLEGVIAQNAELSKEVAALKDSKPNTA